jgi:hypothetical protein
MIKTIKQQENGYLVNGNMSVPMAEGNKDYKEVQEAIKGGTENYPTAIQVIPMPEPTADEIKAEAIAHYKILYMGIVNTKLKELDYDSLATVKLWEGDANFGAEATKILTWYKAIINKNYALFNAGVQLTDDEYLAEINSIVF